MNLSYASLAERLDQFLYEYTLLNSEVDSLRKRIALLEYELQSKNDNNN